MLNAVAQIVDEHGGPATFAALTGKAPGTVRVWKHRNRFPRDAWPEIIKAFPEITLDRLIETEKPTAPTPEPTGAHA